MAQRSTDHTLAVAMAANQGAYLRARQTGSTGVCWDLLILTAANERQASGYRAELALRHRDIGPAGAFFPPIQRSIVVPDPPTGRIGSGGATLRALREAARELGIGIDELSRLRILLIHSGGASQRLPAYSPQGKIFSPIPMQRPDAQIATLFDHLYLTLAGLPERLGAGMLIVAGDVLLVFDHRHVTAPSPGVTALTMRTPAELGLSHGVWVTDARGRVTRTLQKVGLDVMRAHGALDEQNQILLDTGLLFFDSGATGALATLAGVDAGKGLDETAGQQIDLYDEMTSALAHGTEEKAFLRAGPAHIRKPLWKHLSGIDFGAMPLQGHFLHLGTTRQFRDTLTGREHEVAKELFGQNVLARIEGSVDPSSRVFASVLLREKDASVRVGRGSVVEHSILRGAVTIGDDCVVSQVESSKPFTLRDSLLLFQAPVTDQKGKPATVQVICGVHDDFKGRFHDGKCLFLNDPIGAWLDRHGIAPDEVWRGVAPEKRTLWTAQLFPMTASRDDVQAAMWLVAPGRAPARDLARWRKSPRCSMAMILDAVDAGALIAHREVVQANLQTLDLLGAIDRDDDVSAETVISHYVSPAAYEAARGQIARYAEAPSESPAQSVRQARAWWALATLARRPDRVLQSALESSASSAFVKVREAAEEEGATASRPLRGEALAKLVPNLHIDARSPVRLDLAGGWSDTPPYCFDRGGAVVNVAIDLDQGPPVRCTVRTTPQKKLILHSVDLGRRSEITDWPTDQQPNVHDPLAMHYVAMQLAGLVPARGQSVRNWLAKLGVGLEVQTDCRVPKGSGLGTSSILAATLLSALYRVRGMKRSHEQLITDTLLLEQRLGTGGGWQDQAGGIVGGVKITRTAPGVPQQPRVERIVLSDERLGDLQDRLVVYYSGQQRLARDILRRVMGRWLGREPAMVGLMDSLTRGAESLTLALRAGRWSRVATEIARYWEIKKSLFAGSTTPSVDVMFSQCAPHSAACGLAGAGGGGFAYFFCRDARQASRLREFLSERSLIPGTMGTVYQTKINTRGLVVRAL